MKDTSMLLAKTELPKDYIDMGIGEATAIRNSLLSNFRSLNRFTPHVDLSYFPTEGSKFVVDELHRHYCYKDYLQVITGAGAKQILFASFIAFKEMGYKRIITHTPYWSSFPRMAELAGLEFKSNLFDTDDLSRDEDVILIVSPNNPCGSITSPEMIKEYIQNGFKVIHDAAYESEIYGAKLDTMAFHPDVKVYSAAKQWGLSGLRFGWGTFFNEDLYNRVNEIVEATTSGTSVLSQSMVYEALRLKESSPITYNSFISNAFNEIQGNRASFLNELSEEVVSFSSLAAAYIGNSMFVWLELMPGININDAKVRVIDGAAFGSPGWIRCNIAINRRDCILAGKRINELGKCKHEFGHYEGDKFEFCRKCSEKGDLV